MTEDSAEHPTEDTTNGELGATLRQLRKAANLSLAGLQARTHYSRGYLSKIENGLAPLTPKIALVCDDAVGAGGALARLAQARHAARQLTPTVRTIDLPPATGCFYGRDEVLATIAKLLGRRDEPARSARLIALYGLPGVGKTELAIQAAGHVADTYSNCLFIDLHGDRDALDSDDVIGRVLRRLGLPGEAIPHDADEQTALYRRTVRDRQLLLVLDDARSARQVVPLLPPGGRSDVLVTSRSRLAALDEADHVQVPLLNRLPARQLFARITGLDAAQPDVADRIDRITERCGGLPLAVRVAAAGLRNQSGPGMDELARRLAEEPGLGVLDDGTRSVGAVFESAFTSLAPELSRTLSVLSLHPGDDFDQRAAALLADTAEREAARLLDQLVDASLLSRSRAGRFAFHDLVRTFTAERAGAPIPGPRERLLEGYLHIVQHADLMITPSRHRLAAVQPEPAHWYAAFADAAAAARWLHDEQDNLVHVCELAVALDRPDVCWRLAYALRDFYFRTKRWGPWIRTHRLALNAAERCAEPWAMAVTMNNLGLAYAETEQYVLAADQYTRALQLFRELGDGYGMANAIGHQAWVLHCLGQHDVAIQLGRTALRFYEEHNVRRNAAITLRTIALAEAAARAFDAAIGHLHHAQGIFAAEGLVLDETMTLNCIGEVYAEAADPARSVKHFRAAHRLGQTGGSTFEQARALRGLAAAAAASGHREEAARLVGEAHLLHAGYRLVPRQVTGRSKSPVVAG